MLEFSTKVTFMHNGKKHVGRICMINEDGTYEVVTTGPDGDLWNLPEKLLTVVPWVPFDQRNKIKEEL